MFGKKKSTPSSTPSATSTPKVEVEGIGTADGRPFTFRTTVHKDDVWSKHMVTEAAIAQHDITGNRVEIRRWGTVESGRLDYS